MHIRLPIIMVAGLLIFASCSHLETPRSQLIDLEQDGFSGAVEFDSASGQTVFSALILNYRMNRDSLAQALGADRNKFSSILFERLECRVDSIADLSFADSMQVSMIRNQSDTLRLGSRALFPAGDPTTTLWLNQPDLSTLPNNEMVSFRLLIFSSGPPLRKWQFSVKQKLRIKGEAFK
jgi:hypothetical protein